MKDSLSLVASVIVASLLLFIVPIQGHINHQHRIANMLALQVVSRFVEEVCIKGFISPAMYREFVEQLNASGFHFRISLRHNKKIYVPNESAHEKQKEGEIQFVELNDEYDTEYITGILFPGKNDNEHARMYLMNVGDEFDVWVESMDKANWRNSDKPAVFIPFGGTIQHAAH